MKNHPAYKVLKNEIDRIDNAKTAKRNEKIIEGFTTDSSPRAIIKGKKYLIFNSNDYLGLRFNKLLRKGEMTASEKFGTGPGAVRFISGTLKVHRDLEIELAKFHNKEEAMIFSSAFATNMAVIFCLIKGQSKDSFVSGDAVVISDSLNHRSIIDGIRVANLPKEQRLIYKHLDYHNLDEVLTSVGSKYSRALIITDGIFSMLGEAVNLAKIAQVIDKHRKNFKEGILLVVDDSHGVAAFGKTGRGVEETGKTQADVLIGTMGKGFGSDGGYVTGDKIIIDYLRESAATYIYSNSISPGVAGAALAAVKLVGSKNGAKLLANLKTNMDLFKKIVKLRGFTLAADSYHPIQPILVGDPAKTKALTEELFKNQVLVTSINYPVVPAGRDEIRVQISASHTKKDIEQFVKILSSAAKKLKIC